MASHEVTIDWRGGDAAFTYETYSRNHDWRFGPDLNVAASAAPEFHGDAGRVDPEQAFVAAISSCHMLSLLAIAARKRLVVDSYRDHATGYLRENAAGRLAVTRVVLRPEIVFGGAALPSEEQVNALHTRAHRECFIANSVTTEIEIEAAH